SCHLARRIRIVLYSSLARAPCPSFSRSRYITVGAVCTASSQRTQRGCPSPGREIMPKSATQIDICLEAGAKRVLASALEWPGWARGGRDRAAALQALVDYGPRYARVLRGTRLGFHAPAGAPAFAIVEILKGN